jgi:glycosyltransferase involved in cell wall biosynthesis
MDQIGFLDAAPLEPRTARSVVQPRVESALTRPIRVLHIVADLRTGGAETMLAQVISNSNRKIFQHQVLSMRSAADIGEILRGQNIKIDVLGVNVWLGGIFKIFTMRRIIKGFQPDIIHTWLYHANVVGGLAGISWSDARVVWGLHSGWLSRNHTKWLTRFMRRIGGWLSGLVPDSILCCTHSVQEFHAGLGYKLEKLVIVSNGVDLERFYPDCDARLELRREWSATENQLVIGMVARLDPQKDFRTFLDAAVIVRRAYPNARFILCGSGFDGDNAQITKELSRRHLEGHVTLLGFRSDVQRVMAALDVLVLSSRYGEALPLVVMEAMACGLPVVASDLGDIQRITGGWGKTVSPGSAQEFAEAMIAYARLSEEERSRLALNARERIAEMFSLGSAVHQHETLYRRLAEMGASVTQSADGWLIGDVNRHPAG